MSGDGSRASERAKEAAAGPFIQRGASLADISAHLSELAGAHFEQTRRLLLFGGAHGVHVVVVVVCAARSFALVSISSNFALVFCRRSLL